MIIVYGGTFNPPTKAHETIANLLINKYNPEKFIFLPVGEGYTWKEGFVSFKHRKNMLELLFKGELFEISDIENNKQYNGTYWALNNIKEAYKSDVYFVMGADNIEQLDKWLNYQKLVQEYKFLVLTRKGFDVKKIIKEKFSFYEHNFSIIELDLNVSSKEFRDNPILINHLDDKIIKYIKKNNLYEVNNVKA